MRSYEAARRICSFLENIGWLAVVGGVILAFVLAESVSSYARPGAAFAAAIPGIVFSVIGLFCVGGVQGWRSSVDTAEYTQQMLKIARDQLEVSRQSLRGNKTEALSFGDTVENETSSSGPSFADMSATGASNSTEQSRDTEPEARPIAPPERPAMNQELSFQGRKLIEYADGSYTLGDRNFSDLDAVKEHIRFEKIRAGKHGF